MNKVHFQVLKRFYHPGLPPFKQPHFHPNSSKVAINDNLGQHTYGDIFKHSDKVANALSRIPKANSKNIAFLTGNNHQYSVSQFGIWKSGHSCVPLCKTHPPDTLKYYIQDSEASTLIVTKEFVDKVNSEFVYISMYFGKNFPGFFLGSNFDK